VSDFFINEIRVDLARCKLYRDSETVSLEPKVIQVLHYLARHQGQVVSHKTLLDAIWTNTVVEASALQRCIAQLRKAFRDDARNQHIIATYPKKGYSLVAEVSWEGAPQASTASIKKPIIGPALAASGFAVLLLLVFAGTNFMAARVQGERPLAVEQVQTSLLSNPTLVAAFSITDDFPVYSPDGRFVVYPRYLDENKAHLWARDLAYGNDFLLTEEAGNYEQLAWSRDGSQLVFIDTTCEARNCISGQCTSLKSVTISQSETNSLSVQKLIDCSPERLLAPQWLNNREIAVIEINAGQASLKRYDLKTLEKSFLYQSDEVIPYQLSFSRQTNILTITAMNLSGGKELIFLDISNGAINRNETTTFVPRDNNDNWYPSSTPL
jgi:DNA-binding winged helix-turn-helix (wHTH) protein/roadblock/LC7 domain-containing protein